MSLTKPRFRRAHSALRPLTPLLPMLLRSSAGFLIETPFRIEMTLSDRKQTIGCHSNRNSSRGLCTKIVQIPKSTVPSMRGSAIAL